MITIFVCLTNESLDFQMGSKNKGKAIDLREEPKEVTYTHCGSSDLRPRTSILPRGKGKNEQLLQRIHKEDEEKTKVMRYERTMSDMRDREIENLTHMLNESRKTIYYKDKEIERLQLDYHNYIRSSTFPPMTSAYQDMPMTPTREYEQISDYFVSDPYENLAPWEIGAPPMPPQWGDHNEDYTPATPPFGGEGYEKKNKAGPQRSKK